MGEKGPLPHLPWGRRSESEEGTARDVARKRGRERQRTGAYSAEVTGPSWLHGLSRFGFGEKNERREGKGNG